MKMRFFTLVMLLCLLTGCALKKDYVEIEYKPCFTPQKIVGIENIEVAINVSDHRVKEHVGDKVWENFDIMASNSLVEGFKNAIAWELQERGFRIGHDGYNLDIEIHKFYNHYEYGPFAANANSETVLNVNLRNKEGMITYSKIILGFGDESPCFLLSGTNARIALERSLYNTIQKLMNDPDFIWALSNS